MSERVENSLEPQLIALVMEGGKPSEVTIIEIRGMGENWFNDLEFDARQSAHAEVDEWPEDADFAKVRLYDFRRFEGQPSGIEGIPRWEIPPHWEMKREILGYIQVVPDEDGNPKTRRIEEVRSDGD